MPSRFLREIPSALVHEVRPKVQVSRPAYGGGGRRLDNGLTEAPAMPQRARNAGHASLETPAIRLGQNVRHPTFGTGFVTDVEGSGAHARVQVNFDEAGSKWLVLAYANLTGL
jgi:DNA helicase-2/ATP-dependent DNA helicase PcrA